MRSYNRGPNVSVATNHIGPMNHVSNTFSHVATAMYVDAATMYQTKDSRALNRRSPR